MNPTDFSNTVATNQSSHSTMSETKRSINDLARKGRKRRNKRKRTNSSRALKVSQWVKLISLHLATFLDHTLKVTDDQTKFLRSHVSVVFGTQEPTLTLRTGITTLTSSGTNLTQVVAMDVTGIAAWTSFANIFDEYRVKRAKLHIVPLYSGYGATASALAAMPIIVVIDYDDATAIGSLTNAIQYDTQKILHMGSAFPKEMNSKLAMPQGQPDLAWVTTATPTVPFWFKFWSITTLIPSTAALGYAYIEAEVEFRQVA